VDALALPAGYTEWPAPGALRDAVACLWARVTTSGVGRPGLVLPDGCADLIWEQGRGAFVAGPDTGPVPTMMAAGAVVLGVRFRPSAGGPALGISLSELRDQRVDLADLRPGDARRLPATLDPDTAAARVLDVAAALVAGGAPDTAVTWAAHLLRDPRARTEDVAAEVGLSMRQLRRRCHSAVGYGPKTLQRVLRFRRFVSRIDARPWHPGDLDLAVLAAEAGYADQAHLTRECGRLSGLTPAALARQRAARGTLAHALPHHGGQPLDGVHAVPRAGIPGGEHGYQIVPAVAGDPPDTVDLPVAVGTTQRQPAILQGHRDLGRDAAGNAPPL
jgi:AraC-like DNA-binding protein